MELLEGETLAARLQRMGRLGLSEAAEIVREAAAGLSAAHEQGIVHLDLKPDNLFLATDPTSWRGERTKILDFGIAKLSSNEPSALKTRTGMMMGTPVYMSPEQCRGAGDIDQRSDIYSIGCVMVTMLTGRPPFEAEASGDLIVAHLREPPPRIATRVPGIPDFVELIALRCLAKSPAHRFASTADLIAALTAAEDTLLRAGAPATGPGPVAASSALLPRAPATTLGGATGQTVLARPARARRPIGPLLVAAIAIAGAATVSITYVVTRAHRRASPAASGPLVETPPSPAALVASPTFPPDAAIDAAVDAAAPPAPAAPPVATDVVAIDAGIPDARPARPHRASTRRPVEHAPPTDPASHEPVDRGD